MSRDDFLQRVRQAVTAGNRAGAPALPERGKIGYQGAGPDAVQRFVAELAAAGGVAHVVPDGPAALACILELVQQKDAQKILLGRSEVVDALGLENRLTERGCSVLVAEGFTSASCREPFFSADLGISGVAWLIAETGSVVATAAPQEPRSVSLLPPVHIAVAHARQILPDLFDLFATLKPDRPGGLPSCTVLITGPSKTGDIELKLVTGVHGPGEIHVVVIAERVGRSG